MTARAPMELISNSVSLVSEMDQLGNLIAKIFGIYTLYNVKRDVSDKCHLFIL